MKTLHVEAQGNKVTGVTTDVMSDTLDFCFALLVLGASARRFVDLLIIILIPLLLVSLCLKGMDQ